MQAWIDRLLWNTSSQSCKLRGSHKENRFRYRVLRTVLRKKKKPTLEPKIASRKSPPITSGESQSIISAFLGKTQGGNPIGSARGETTISSYLHMYSVLRTKKLSFCTDCTDPVLLQAAHSSKSPDGCRCVPIWFVLLGRVEAKEVHQKHS